jgi:hypothetical protein
MALFWKAPIAAAALQHGSRELLGFGYDRCGKTLGFTVSNWTTERRTFLDLAREKIGARPAEPIHRFPHERSAQMHAPSHLRGEDLESFGTPLAGGRLVSNCQRRCDREMVSSVQCGRLAYDPEITVDLLELPAHPIEVAQQRCVIAGVGIQEAIERGFYDGGLARPPTLRSGLQSLDELFRELDGDFSFHG